MQFRSLAFTIVFAAAMSFVACGSDSSSGTNRESDSSSGTASSSSVTSGSSSADVSTVTTADLSANMVVGTMLGDTLVVSAGTNGLYTLWFTKGGQNYGYAVCKANFSGASLSFKSGSCGVGTVSDTTGKKIDSALASGVTVKFSKAGSTLQVSVNGGTAVDVTKFSFAGTAGFISKASALEGKKLSWSSGDSNSVYYFYKNGIYFRTGHISGDLWEAGYYDVQQQWLLLVPKYYKTDGSLRTLSMYNVSTSYKLYASGDVAGVAYDGTDFNVTYPDVSKLATTWTGVKSDTSWTIVLNSDASFTATAKKVTTAVMQKSGSWGLFGDRLVFKISTCSNTATCPIIEYGVLSSVTDSSLTYTTSDTSVWALPANWTLPDYQ
ncbi:MAG: hypothetical protein WCS54_05110 [Fibrobacteraceae bacterium]